MLVRTLPEATHSSDVWRHDQDRSVLITDWEFDDLVIELDALNSAGLGLIQSQARTPRDVINAADGHLVVAIVTQYAPITSEVLDAIPNLGLIVSYGVGVDQIDVPAAASRGITVCNVTDYDGGEVAAHAASLVLSLTRGLPFLDRSVRAGGWDYKLSRPVRRLGNLTIGFVGLGRIGSRACGFLRPFFGRVVGCDPYLSAGAWPHAVERMDLDGLLECSDVLSLHVPLVPETDRLLGAERLARLPVGAVIVNTSRGGVVDEDALLRALDSGRVSAAGLDVMTVEPAQMNHPLRSHPRVLLTPHSAWYSTESEVELRSKAIGRVVDWDAGLLPNDIVEPTV